MTLYVARGASTINTYSEALVSSGGFNSWTTPGGASIVAPVGVFQDDTNLYITHNTTKIDKGIISTLGRTFSNTITGNVTAGVTVDQSGNIYIVDNINSICLKLDSSGNPLTSYGTFGSGNNNLNTPRYCITDSTLLYITDSSNHRVMIRKCSDLSYVGQFTIPAIIWFPRGIVLTLTNIICVGLDFTNSKFGIFVFDLNGNLVNSNTTIAGNGDAQFNTPEGCTTDFTNIYLSDNLNNRIKSHKLSDLSFVAKVANSTPFGIWTTLWWSKFYTTPYTQIAGGASGKRFRPNIGLYTPFNGGDII